MRQYEVEGDEEGGCTGDEEGEKVPPRSCFPEVVGAVTLLFEEVLRRSRTCDCGGKHPSARNEGLKNNYQTKPAA